MDQLEHYNIIEKIGSGGMGDVYRAFDTQLERDVAIKVIHPAASSDGQNANRLIREARAAAKIVHPNVVTIYEVGEGKAGRYIVMEYIKGVPLSNLIQREAPLDAERSIKLIVQVLKALELAHSMGIIHRDIKADNILITDKDEAKVLDFGIAKMSQKAGLTVAGEVLGTVEFMAPEQMLGEDVDHRCDLYAAGVVLYQTLTRELPFQGQNPVEILFKKLNEEPLALNYYNKKLNSRIDSVIFKALSHAKEDRWDSARQMIERLEALISTQAPQTENGFLIYGDEPEFQEESKGFRSVFIGRDKEFKRLVKSFQKIHNEGGQTIFLSGEAGVGKSTLAKQFKNYVKHQDVWVLSGTCLYHEGMDAYLPYIDALRGFFSRENSVLTDMERTEIKNMVREKVPILAEFTERFCTTFFTSSWNSNQEKKENNANLFEGLHILISLLSEYKPLVLIVDDLQWADEASLRLFHYLSRKIISNRVFLFGISRTDHFDLQEDGKPKMIVEVQNRMRREGIVDEIKLQRLTRNDCDLLVDKSLTNTAFSDDFYQGMYRETKGNPFFVIETIKLFREKGGIYEDNDIWIDKKIDFKSEVPNRVEDIFIRRLSGLNEEDRELLQVGSVLGYKFDPSILARIMELKKIDLLKKLQKIERDFQIILSIDNLFQFEHPMLCDLLYNEIPQALAAEYHLMIAGEFKSIHGDDFGSLVGDVAQHFRRGGDHVNAIPLLYKAALRTFDLSAYREASMFFDDLLASVKLSKQKLPGNISEEEIYFKLGICYEEAGNWQKSLDAYRKLIEVSDLQQNPEKKVDALMRIGRIQDVLGDWEDASKYYEECLALAEKHHIKNVYSRVYNKFGVYYFQKGDFDKALRYFKKTIRSADSESGEFDKAHAYTNVGIIANILRGEHSVALGNFNKALKIYKKKKSQTDQARVYHNIGMFYSDHAEWLESIKAFEKCLQLTDDNESKHLRALTFLNMGKAYARQKKLVKAKQLTEKALKMFKRMADIFSIAEAYHIYGIIYGAQNNFERAEIYLLDAIKIFKNKDFLEGLAETHETYSILCNDFGYKEKAKTLGLKAIEYFDSLNLDSKVKTIKKIIDSIDDDAIKTDKINIETSLLSE